jgi:hypothetical protein
MSLTGLLTAYGSNSGAREQAMNQGAWLFGCLFGILLGVASAVLKDAPTAGVLLSGAAASALLTPLAWALGRLRLKRLQWRFLLGWLGNGLWSLTAFGFLLKGGTHHRPLGGATFAALGLALLIALWLLGRRLVLAGSHTTSSGRRPSSLPGQLWVALGALGSVAVGVAVWRADPAGLSVGLDLVLLLASAVLAARLAARGASPLKSERLGLGTWAALVTAGAVIATRVPEASESVSPVWLGLFAIFR